MRRPRLSYRENYLRAVTFMNPEYIPAVINVFWPLWNSYRERLEEIAEKYNMLFPGFRRGCIKYESEPGIIYVDEYVRDPFGCLWHFRIKGYQGQVVGHPLDDWSKWKGYELPDPDDGLPVEGGRDLIPWDQVYENMERAEKEGRLIVAAMPHGFFFQRLYYLRGFRNLLVDFIKRPIQLYELIEALTEYNLALVEKFLEFGKIDVFYFGDDLGLQDRLPISPRTFKEFIFPTYKKIFSRAKKSGAKVRLHTDGHVVEIFDYLMETGVDILNIQDRVNGLDNIAKFLKGKICIDLDIDRQKLIPFGTPREIRDYIKEVIRVLSLRKGGLMLYAEVHPPTPLENIEALAQALMKNIWLS